MARYSFIPFNIKKCDLKKNNSVPDSDIKIFNYFTSPSIPLYTWNPLKQMFFLCIPVAIEDSWYSAGHSVVRKPDLKKKVTEEWRQWHHDKLVAVIRIDLPNWYHRLPSIQNHWLTPLFILQANHLDHNCSKTDIHGWHGHIFYSPSTIQ